VKIIVLSHNEDFIDLVSFILKQKNIDILSTTDRETIIEIAQSGDFLSIVLDLSNPTPEDFYYWSELLQLTSIPILVIHSNASDVKQVLLRQKALINLTDPITTFWEKLSAERNKKGQNSFKNLILLSPDIIFDIAGHCIKKRNESILLSTTEFKLLYLLANNIGETFTVNELIDYIEITGISTLYVYIQKLREKIEKNPKNPHILVNHRGRGYKLIISATNQVNESYTEPIKC
jgi:DNA-binding response OmpR family regulator